MHTSEHRFRNSVATFHCSITVSSAGARIAASKCQRGCRSSLTKLCAPFLPDQNCSFARTPNALSITTIPYLYSPPSPNYATLESRHANREPRPRRLSHLALEGRIWAPRALDIPVCSLHNAGTLEIPPAKLLALFSWCIVAVSLPPRRFLSSRRTPSRCTAAKRFHGQWRTARAFPRL